MPCSPASCSSIGAATACAASSDDAPGIVRRDAHRRRRDLRIARDRQQPNREQTEQRDDDRDHGAEDRTPDEEVARLRSSGRRAGGRFRAVRRRGTGFTTRPGATFCVPSTTTRSPGRQSRVDDPERAAPRPGLHVARDDGVARRRRRTRIAARVPALPRAAERRAPGARESLEAHAHELPGKQSAVGVRELRAELLGAARRVERRRDEVEPARARQQRAVGKHHAHRESCCRDGSARRRADRAPTSPTAATTDGTSRRPDRARRSSSAGRRVRSRARRAPAARDRPVR